jgi:hypothetical protein
MPSFLNRVFSAEKIIEHTPLNAAGMQVFRAVGARLVYRSRGVGEVNGLDDKVATLVRDGMLVWTDFLPPAEFGALRAECLGLAGRHEASYVRQSGPNRDARVLASSLERSTVPALTRFLNDPRLRSLLEGAERRRLGDLFQYAKLEHLTQGEVTDTNDPQTDLHSDIFFSSHKAWFYLTDVTDASGPLTFVKGSHRLTPSRLRHIYAQSVRMKPGDDPSRRVSAEERVTLPAETAVLCRANTLVIANTCGYHRRRQGVPGEERSSIHLEVRANPFLVGRRRHVS